MCVCVCVHDYEHDETGVQIQVGRELLVPLDQKVKSGQSASLDRKAHLADKEMLDCREVLEHRVRVDS